MVATTRCRCWPLASLLGVCMVFSQTKSKVGTTYQDLKLTLILSHWFPKRAGVIPVWFLKQPHTTKHPSSVTNPKVPVLSLVSASFSLLLAGIPLGSWGSFLPRGFVRTTPTYPSVHLSSLRKPWVSCVKCSAYLQISAYEAFDSQLLT